MEGKKTINHRCTRCGTCCMNRGDIYLTPLDVLRISQYLHISQQAFIEKYCERERLELHLIATGSDKRCIFLKQTSKNKYACTIYKCRTMACYLFPLSTTVGFRIFTKNYSPFCAKGKEIPLNDFLHENYSVDFLVAKLFTSVVNNLYSKEELDEDACFKFLFFNNSQNEILEKLESF